MTGGQTDRTTKILLGLIAAGLRVNVAERLFTPKPVSAQNFSTMESYLSDIQGDVRKIARGTCVNGKLC